MQKQVEHATEKRTFCKSLLRKAFGHCFSKILHAYDVAQDVAKFGPNLDKFLQCFLNISLFFQLGIKSEKAPL